jgi:hypothetical protein
MSAAPGAPGAVLAPGIFEILSAAHPHDRVELSQLRRPRNERPTSQFI